MAAQKLIQAAGGRYPSRGCVLALARGLEGPGGGQVRTKYMKGTTKGTKREKGRPKRTQTNIKETRIER